MALSIRERILVAIKDALVTLVGVQVYRNQAFPTEADRAPLLIVRDGGQSNDEGVGFGLAFYTLRVAIEGQVWSAGEADMGADANDLYARVLAKLYADRTLGGLAIDLKETELEDLDLDRESGNFIAGFLLSLDVWFQTRSSDPTALGPG